MLILALILVLIIILIALSEASKNNHHELETVNLDETPQKKEPPVPQTYYVSFDDRGTTLKTIGVIDVIDKSLIPVPEKRNPKRFCGWTRDYKSFFDFDKPIIHDITLHAIWENKRITFRQETQLFPWYKWIERTKHYWCAEVGGHRIELDVDSHTYKVDGIKVKCVTELLDTHYYGYYEQETKSNEAIEALNRIDEIEWCESKGGEGEYKEWYNYKRLKSAFGLKPTAMRLMVAIFDENGTPLCAGTLCSLLKNSDGTYGIMGISRTKEFNPMRLMHQLNLYRIGLVQCAGINVEDLICLRLRDDLSQRQLVPVQEEKTMAFLYQELGHRPFYRR